MWPATLAIVEDDAPFAELLAGDLQRRGIAVKVYSDSNELLADPLGFDHEFYVVDVSLPGISGTDLIRILRRRSMAGVLVVTGHLAPEVFSNVLEAGADMYLAKPVRFEQVAVAVRAVHRRAAAALDPASNWRLDRRAGELVAPDGARIALSDNDLAVLECFIEAQGGTVTREALSQRLGGENAEVGGNRLHATMYRLRRRIERATPILVPMQAHSRVGYVFRGKLSAV